MNLQEPWLAGFVTVWILGGISGWFLRATFEPTATITQQPAKDSSANNHKQGTDKCSS
jgi:uncharacterized membrane protein